MKQQVFSVKSFAAAVVICAVLVLGAARATAQDINRKPLQDFGTKVSQQIAAGEVNIAKSFSVVVTGELDRDGKLLNPIVSEKSGDSAIIEVAVGFVSAVSDSGLLRGFVSLLKEDTGATIPARFAITQNEQTILLELDLELRDEPQARMMRSGINVLISAVRDLRSNNYEGKTLEYATVLSTGKTLNFKLDVPREVAHKIIQEQLTAALKQ